MRKLSDRIAAFKRRMADIDADLQIPEEIPEDEIVDVDISEVSIPEKKKDPIEKMPDPEPDDIQLGAVSPGLRAKMGEALADVFDNFGPEIYNGVVLALKDSLKTAFEEGSKQIEDAVKDELGARGIKAAQKYFRSWMQELTDVIVNKGLADAAVAASDEASTLAAEFASESKSMSEAPDLPGLEDIENVPLEEVEVVEEKPAEADENAAPAFEEAGAEGGEGGGMELPAIEAPASPMERHRPRMMPRQFKR